MSESAKSNRIFSFVIRNPWTVIITALFITILSIGYTVKNLEFLTGRDDLMPRHAPFQQDYQAYRTAFGDQEEIAIVIEGDDPLLVSHFSDSLYKRLSQEKRLFVDILYPGGLPFFRQNALLFTDLDDLKSMSRTIEISGPILKELAAAPSIQTLFSSLTSNIDDYLLRPSPEKLNRLTFMLNTLDKGFSGFDGKNSAISMDSFLSGGKDGKPSMMENAGKQQVIAIRPLKEQDSFVPAEKAIKKIREELNILKQKREFKGVTAGITGVPVLEYEEMSTSMDDMKIASLLSLVLTVVLLLIAFRGLRNTVAAMTALLSSISIAFGMATVLVGHLNILSMAFAVMLLGLGVEYGIQVVLNLQEQLERLPFEQAMQESLISNLRPILIACATTALAFLTFLLTDFRGIAELGLIAATGVFVCFIGTFTVLPAMLVILKQRKPVKRKRESYTVKGSKLERLFSRPGLIVGITALLALCGGIALTRVPFDFNMLNLQAKGLESVNYAYKLMKSKENSGYFAVSMAKDKEDAERLTREFEKLPSVDHIVSLNTLVPDQQPEKMAEIKKMRVVMADVNPLPYQENLNVMELPAIFEGFRERVERLKNRLETEKLPDAKPVSAFLVTLDRFFAGLEKEKDGNALNMLRDMQEKMFAPLPEKLGLLKETLNAHTVTEADIPEKLRQRFVGKDGRFLLQIAPKNEIFNERPLEEFVTQVKHVDPHATGEPVSVYESFKILKNSYLQAFLYALAGVVLIVMIAFRSFITTVLGIAPLLAGLLLMVAGMWLFGLKFNVANIIVMPLLLGVGIDSAIYIINRYLRVGESPVQVVASSAGKGVLLNALTIMFSFGVLMVASHQGVFSIGAVMSLGMVSIVLAFLLFLPALLMLYSKKQGGAS